MDELTPPEWMDEGPELIDPDTPAQPAGSGMLAYRLTDSGNADRLVALHGGHLRHVSEMGWHYWSGTHWERDRLGKAQEAAKHTIAEFRRQAERALARDPKNEAMKAMASYASVSENASRINNMLKLAESDPKVAITPDDLDAHPYLFNTANGTIDLRTGALYAHRPADLLTICAPSSLRPWGELPTQCVLQAFMDSVQPDTDTQAFIWRCIGMSLIGEQRDHVVLFAYGEGGNGKGTLFRAVRKAIGKYFHPIPSDMLVERQFKAHAAQTAQLMGKRFVVADELPPNKAFDVAEVKKLSGGDELPAQFMRENWFSFTPSHTLWLQGNDKPRVPGMDYGMWRRLRLIPFQTKVQVMDPDLDRKLDAERDLVLRMAVDGAVAYMRDGLGSCREVDDATASYRSDEDSIGQFLDECCDRGPTLYCAKESMRKAIEQWWRDEGKVRAPSNATLKADFAKRGITDARKHGEPRRWNGVQLNAETSRAVANSPDWYGDP